MGYKTEQQPIDQLCQKETTLINRLRNETLHTKEKLLRALPTNREFLSKILEK